MRAKRLWCLMVMGLLLGMAKVQAAPAGPAANTRLICVYDPAGKAGDYYALMSDFATVASGWGVKVQVRAYTDELTATRDYDAGQCDGVVATGARLQGYNNFPTTLEAIGALQSYDMLKQMVISLNTYESAAKKLRKGDHETVGIIPIGVVYFFVRDRRIDSVPELAGIRIATLNFDKASPVMVDRVGAIAVPADLSTLGPKFNNGDVDACYVSTPAYGPFELHRGLGAQGGVVKLPLAMATFQVLIRHPRFPADFPKKARADLTGRFDRAAAVARKTDAQIPARYWIPIPTKDLPAFEELFLGVRLKLRDEKKAYDPAMLSALRKARCTADPTRSECAEKKE